MALVLIAGTEHPTTLLEPNATSGTVTFETTTVRTGNGAIKILSSGGYVEYLFTAGSPVWIRFYARFDVDTGTRQLFVIQDSSNNELGRLSMDPSGVATVNVFGGTTETGGSPAVDTWHLFEAKYTKGSGSDATLEWKFDGIFWMNSKFDPCNTRRMIGVIQTFFL